MNALAADIAGSARAGTLYGIGVGPGDVRYLTLRLEPPRSFVQEAERARTAA